MNRRAFLPLLVLAAGLPVLAAAWAVLSPSHMVSSEMTWDLMFNLAGAWQLWFGHVPHVDFHEPVGTLTFLLTEAGFWLTGPSPKAVPVGMAIVAAVLFAIACLVAARRLTLLPGVLFVVFVCLIVLRPANVGDHPNAYSFAMAYNRYGWSGLSVLALLMFEPPARRGLADIVEMACTALILAALFYLKMTYFAAGVAMLVVALVASPHVRTRWRGWGVVVLASVALVLLPFNWPYLADLKAAADAGIVRDDTAFFFNDFAENAGEYAAYFAAVGPRRLAVASRSGAGTAGHRDRVPPAHGPAAAVAGTRRPTACRWRSLRLSSSMSSCGASRRRRRSAWPCWSFRSPRSSARPPASSATTRDSARVTCVWSTRPISAASPCRWSPRACSPTSRPAATAFSCSDARVPSVRATNFRRTNTSRR